MIANPNKKRRLASGLACAGLGLTAGLITGRWSASWLDRREPRPAHSVHSGPTVEQIQVLATLVTIRVDVADAQETHLDGHVGGVKAAVLVKGDFLLGTDLSRAAFTRLDAVAHTAVLELPQPRVTSPRLDHDRTRVFALSERGLWLVTPGDKRTSATVIERAYRDAQKFVTDAAGDPALLNRARRQAEQVLGAFFKATGWEITIRWSD